MLSLGGNCIMEVDSTLIDKLSHLTPEKFLIMSSLLDVLTEQEHSKDIKKRIGVAKNINFPSNFDEIDYGIEELFGLNE